MEDLGVERRLGEEDGVLLGRDAKLVVEGVVPDLLHVVPAEIREGLGTGLGEGVQGRGQDEEVSSRGPTTRAWSRCLSTLEGG